MLLVQHFPWVFTWYIFSPTVLHAKMWVVVNDPRAAVLGQLSFNKADRRALLWNLRSASGVGVHLVQIKLAHNNLPGSSCVCDWQVLTGRTWSYLPYSDMFRYKVVSGS